MQREDSPLAEARRAKFLVECRAIRLWIASHPGCSALDIKRNNSGRVDIALAKMLNMKLISCKRGPDSTGKVRFLWYVIPQ